MEKITIANKIVEVPEQFNLLVDTLCRCDGRIMAIDLEQSECRDILLSAGYVLENDKGHLYGTNKLREDKDMILSAYKKTLN